MYYTELNKPERHLVSLMTELNYGRIENVFIKKGSIFLTKETKKVASIKLDLPYTVHTPSRRDGDFELNSLQEGLIKRIRHLRKGIISKIHIVNGLPVNIDIEEALVI